MSLRKSKPLAQEEKKWKGKVIKQMNGGDRANFSGNKCKRGSHTSNRSKNMDCFNYGKPGHFARDCTKSKVLFD